jgi:methyl-accepting chemotaxis protein
MHDVSTPTQRRKSGDLLESSQVFVAPRVIDENAYARFAEDLRGLLDRVSDESGSLSESVTQARSFIEEIAAKREQRKGEIESITKLLHATEAKARRIDETIKAADEKLAALDDIEARADAVAERKASEIEQRIESMLEDFERKLEDRAADREQKFLWAAHETEEVILERLAELRSENDRATSVLGRPMGHPPEAPVACDSLIDVLRRAEEGAERLGELRRSIAEAEYKARADVESLEGALHESSAQTEALKAEHEALHESTDRARRAAREAESSLHNRSDELADLSASLSSLVDRAGGASDSLREVMEGCDALRYEAQAKHDELYDLTETVSTLITQLEPWRPLLEPVDEDGELPPLPPVLQRIVTDFRSGMALDLARLADAVNSVADRRATPLGGSKGGR